MQFASPALFGRLREGATAVLPSRLLASKVTHQFAQQQVKEGLVSWPRPFVLSLDAWLTNCWREARYTRPEIPALLSPAQERLLWNRIIAKEHPELFDAGAAARLASQAERAIADWRISADSKDWDYSGDSQQFQAMLQLFRRECRNEHWMTRGEIWAALPRWISTENTATIFTGFEPIPPALRQVATNSRIESVEAARPAKNIIAKDCGSLEAEIEFAARWARGIFESAPQRSIGVFIPDLKNQRAFLERTFEQVFYPSHSVHTKSRPDSAENSVFHITTPKRLNSHPLVANARLILELLRPRIRISDASAILRCPWLSEASEERNARALADLELRKHRDLDVTLQDIEYASRNCALLEPVWGRIRRLSRGIRHRNELALWSELFGDVLGAAGWPGSSELSAEEQTLVESWKEALSEFASLGLIAGPVSLDFALGQLDDVLSGRGWERGDWFSPVQVFDSADAHALRFDAAVAVGLSEDSWPPVLRPLPFIPLPLQRSAGVPGSDPQQTRREHHRQTNAILGAAAEMVATFSERLAPVARRFVRVTKRDISIWTGPVARDSYSPAALDVSDDSYAPVFKPTEAAYGGTGILKAQSLCPFRSFAENRLRATRPEDACFGFDARDRGSFLHAAMEQVWRGLGDFRKLRTLDSNELERLVQSAVDSAVEDDQSSPLHELAILTERHRLKELILEWLEIERQRKQPFTVEHMEERRSFELKGLHLRLRVDRIDRLDNGGVLLIDYKSGEQKAKNLAGDRPAEPQLLVYAASLEEPVEGVFFAQMKPRDLKAVGFSRRPHFPEKSKSPGSVRSDWDEYLEQSRRAIQKLAAEFVGGYAAVDPLRDACTFCNQKPLCRIAEQRSPEDEEDDD
jgi:probable DNA repair protein